MHSDSRSLSIRIVEALAERENVAPTELGYSLQDYIDADALDQLEATQDGAWTLEFAVADHTVTTGSDGTVTIDGVESTGRAFAAADD